MSGFLGSILAPVLSYVGSQQTNATNAGIAAQQMATQQWSQMESERFSQEQRGLAQDYSSNEANIARTWADIQANRARDFDASQADIARNWDRQQRLEVQDWETQMANTAYQRQVADMKAAGINPILAAVKGGGASSPSVSPGSSPSPTSPVPSGPSPSSSGGSVGTIPGASWRAENVLGNAVNSGLSAFRTMADVEQTRQGVEQSKAATAKLSADADVSRATVANTQADTANKLLQPSVIAQQLINMGLEPSKAAAVISSAYAAAEASKAAAGASAAQAGLAGAQTVQQQKETTYFGKTGMKPGVGTSVTQPLGWGAAVLDDAVGKIRDWINQNPAQSAPGTSSRQPYRSGPFDLRLTPGTD